MSEHDQSSTNDVTGGDASSELAPIISQQDETQLGTTGLATVVTASGTTTTTTGPTYTFRKLLTNVTQRPRSQTSITNTSERPRTGVRSGVGSSGGGIVGSASSSGDKNTAAKALNEIRQRHEGQVEKERRNFSGGSNASSGGGAVAVGGKGGKPPPLNLSSPTRTPEVSSSKSPGLPLIPPLSPPLTPVSPAISGHPESLIEQIVSRTSAGSDLKNQIQLINSLSQSVLSYSSCEPIHVWLRCSHLIDSSERPEIREAGLKLLKSCILALFDSSGGVSSSISSNRLNFFSAIRRYSSAGFSKLDVWEMELLVEAVDALCKGGRDIYGLAGLPELLCEWAEADFERQQGIMRELTAASVGSPSGIGGGGGKEKEKEKEKEGRAVQELSGREDGCPLEDKSFKLPFVRLESIGSSSATPAEGQVKERKESPLEHLLSLLTSVHKFSFPLLESHTLSRTVKCYIALASRSLSERNVELGLGFVDALVKYGVVPTGNLEEVVNFVIRVIGTESRTQTLVIRLTEPGPGEPSTSKQGTAGGWAKVESYLEPFNPRLPQLAFGAIRNLLRSPANQALRWLRTALQRVPPPPPPPPSGQATGMEFADGPYGPYEWPVPPRSTDHSECDVPLLVGAVRALKFAFKDFDSFSASSESTSESTGGSGSGGGSYSSAERLLSMGLRLVFGDLKSVMGWQKEEIDSEVLALVEDRLGKKAGRSLGAGREPDGGGVPSPPPLSGSTSFSRSMTGRGSFSAGGGVTELALDKRVGTDEWDMAIELLALSRHYIFKHEVKSRRAWYIEDVSSTKNEQSSVTYPTPAQSSQPVASLLEQYGLIFTRLFVASESNSFTGSTDRLFELCISLGHFIPERIAVSLLNLWERDRLCVPSDTTWLSNLRKIVAAFFVDGSSSLVDRLLKDHNSLAPEEDQAAAAKLVPLSRPNRPAARERAFRLLSNTFESLRGMEPYRNEVAHVILKPLLDGCHEGIFEQPDILAILEMARKAACDAIDDDAYRDDAEEEPRVEGEGEEKRALKVTSSFEMIEETLVKMAEVWQRRGPHTKTTSLNAADAAVIVLIRLFCHALSTSTVSSSNRCVAIFRGLLKILSPDMALSTDNFPKDGLHEFPGMSEMPPARHSRLAILQLLLRLRASEQHRVMVIRDIDVNGLASIISRTRPDPEAAPAQGTAPVAVSEKESEETRGRETRGRARTVAQQMPSEHPSPKSREASSSRTRRRSPSRLRLAPPSLAEALWAVPDRLPFELPASVQSVGGNALLSFDHITMRDWTEADDKGDGDVARFSETSTANRRRVVLPVSEYLRALNRIIRTEKDFDVVSYVLCFLPNQLSNKHFSVGPRAARELHNLRKTLCDHLLRDSLGHSIRLPSGIRQSQLHEIAYQSLSTLIACRSLFNKAQQDEMVNVFCNGLSKSRELAKPCVHALLLACHELRPSMIRHLPDILQHLLRIMSTAFMSVHILELLTEIGQIPALYANFTEEDFRRVFGIALKYIVLHSHESPVESNASRTLAEGLKYAFSQYVFILAYYVIALWFMSLRLSERRKYISFISSQLVQANEGKATIDEPTEVCFDMLARYAYSNADPRLNRSNFSELLSKDGTVEQKERGDSRQKSWILGNGILTIRPLSRAGWVEAVIRRPSGVVVLTVELENLFRGESNADTLLHIVLGRREQDGTPMGDSSIPLPRASEGSRPSIRGRTRSHTVSGSTPKLLPISKLATDSAAMHGSPLAAFTYETPASQFRSQGDAAPDDLAFDPSFLALQMSTFPQVSARQDLIPLPKDDRYNRMVSTLDYCPVVDFHKVGILYVGKHQQAETDILANSYGSPSYTRLFSNLGRMRRLKDCRGSNTAGLDTQNNVDGEWFVTWEDNITQIVYHIATLMPTDLERDSGCNLKKRHIGNDFIKIVYNDSGEEYRFDTISGQFNFINIVIEPQTPAGAEWTAPGMSNNTEFFKVTMQKRADMPDIGPLGEFKMISTDALADFVRQLSLNASIFSQVFLGCVGIESANKQRHKQEYVSNWRQRLRQIKRLKEMVRSESGNVAASSSPMSHAPSTESRATAPMHHDWEGMVEQRDFSTMFG